MPDYKVTVAGSDPIPIRASNPTAARNHAVRDRVTVDKLTTEDAIQFGRDNVALQVAGEEAETAVEPVAGEQEEAGDPPASPVEADPADTTKKK